MRHRCGEVYSAPDVRAVRYLLEFFDENRESITVVDHIPAQGRRVGATHNTGPLRGKVVGLLAIKDTALRVSEADFRRWLRIHKNESWTIMRQVIDNIEGVRRCRGRIDFGIGHTAKARLDVVDIPLKAPQFRDFIDMLGADD